MRAQMEEKEKYNISEEMNVEMQFLGVVSSCINMILRDASLTN